MTDKDTSQENLQDGDTSQQDPIEVEAASKGWVPESQWDKSKGKWRPAQEFLDRGELFAKIDSLKSEIYNVKRDYNSLAEHHRRVSEVEYNKALAFLKQERAKAAEEGDTSEVVKISEKIDDLKDQVRSQQVHQQVQNPELSTKMAEWIKENLWYNSDSTLKTSADALGAGYVANNPGVPFEKVLEYVGKKIPELYPEKFPSKRHKLPDSSPVEGDTRVPASRQVNRKGELSEGDLDETEKHAMNTFIKRKVYGEKVTDSEAKKRYLSDLAKVKGLA